MTWHFWGSSIVSCCSTLQPLGWLLINDLKRCRTALLLLPNPRGMHLFWVTSLVARGLCKAPTRALSAGFRRVQGAAGRAANGSCGGLRLTLQVCRKRGVRRQQAWRGDECARWGVKRPNSTPPTYTVLSRDRRDAQVPAGLRPQSSNRCLESTEAARGLPC